MFFCNQFISYERLLIMACHSESVAWSGSGGLLLDASVTGGSISLDAEHNDALYGSGVSAAQVMLHLVGPLMACSA